MVLFTDTERCQCNEVIWKAVTGVLIFINILLVVVIVWQQKRGNRELKFFPLAPCFDDCGTCLAVRYPSKCRAHRMIYKLIKGRD